MQHGHSQTQYAFSRRVGEIDAPVRIQGEQRVVCCALRLGDQHHALDLMRALRGVHHRLTQHPRPQPPARCLHLNLVIKGQTLHGAAA